MKKFSMLLGLVIISHFLISIVDAETNFSGQPNQQVTFGGVAQPVTATGNVNVSGSTVTIVGAGGAPVPISAAALPLPTSAATDAKQDTGNSSLSSMDGKLPSTVAADRTTAGAPASSRLSDGSAFYKATTPSDTQPVSAASLPLPGGAATSAKQDTGNSSLSSIDVKIATTAAGIKADISGSTVPISANSLPLPNGAATSASQATGNASLSSIDGKLTTTAIGLKVDPSASTQTVMGSVTALLVTSSAPVISTLTATTSSAQIVGANATRKGIECETSCTNTARVFINHGAVAATIEKKPIEVCASWQPPYGVVPLTAIQVIAASGSQTVICTEY